MNFADILQEDRRLAALRILAECGDELNTSVLHSALESLGHRMSRDAVEALAAWLDEQGLVRLESVGPVTVVLLTLRGHDVARGRARHPGVKKPAPRA